ncbi:zinc finger protein 628-like [Schistocerca americana]|uniref:zinc finger protein 628-like n=1 Tax=Schistocerca americana TaxID=7009 RepID=UPI001F4F6BB5|nr:zinc finger protein 628-like [Schistocerca americana]
MQLKKVITLSSSCTVYVGYRKTKHTATRSPATLPVTVLSGESSSGSPSPPPPAAGGRWRLRSAALPLALHRATLDQPSPHAHLLTQRPPLLQSQSTAGHSPSPPPPPPPPRLAIIDFNQLTRGGLEAATGRTRRRRRRPRTRPRHRSASANLLATIDAPAVRKVISVASLRKPCLQYELAIRGQEIEGTVAELSSAYVPP